MTQRSSITVRLRERSAPDPESGCILWLGPLTHGGYGQISVRSFSTSQLAHRVAYEAFVGPIPDGLTIDHLCQNRACINPAHLEPVPRGVNAVRMHQERRRTGRPSGRPRTSPRVESTAVGMTAALLNRLWELQVERGMTDTALAHEVGLSPSYLSRLKSGQRGRYLSMRVALRLAQRFPEIWTEKPPAP